MIIYTHQRSKKKNKTKKQIAQYQSWLQQTQSMSTNFSSGPNNTPRKSNMPVLEIPADRDPRKYKSLQTTACDTSRKPQKIYTGDKMLGIGTLHKSNAVPIFSIEDAKSQATMRR